ncbi:hypothetical protein BJY01DRAFT_75351 [Aspergillus pseudoustus]|uniref:DUF7703 domain-containing protein n=1 Tax=Aspergillus pseudoustus TaxID=1810923 RepID=A0ABR4J6A9_9EURO
MDNLEEVPPGLVHGLKHHTWELKATVAVFLTIALFNNIELLVLICWTFRQPRGLYFWSLLLSVIGIIPYVIGAILHYYNVGPLALGITVMYFGFVALVPMQSFVLYSRLYLVFYNERFLRILLHVLIAVTVVLVIPTTVTTFGSAFIRTPAWNYAYNVIERLQVTGFCAQELFLSGLYIWSTVGLLHLSPEGKNRVKRIIYELLAISCAVMVLDIALIVIEYMNLYYLQVCLKVMVYSIKLKLEFAVLGRLVAVTKSRRIKQKMRVERLEFIGPNVDMSQWTAGTVTEGVGMGTDEPQASASVKEIDDAGPMGEGARDELDKERSSTVRN